MRSTTTILQGIVGSRAYGLNTAQSDTDRLGVFVAPTTDIAGLDWHSSKETRGTSGPTGDDHMEHEVGKFLRLALKANPTILELLWLDEYEINTDFGERVKYLKRLVLSHNHVYNAYYGYAEAQRKKLCYKDKPKYARHALRLLEQGRLLLETGELFLKVENPQRYFDLDDMTPDQRYETVTAEFLAFPDREKPSMLSPKPYTDDVRDVLYYIRSTYI